jgi:hypothetical protein
MGPELVVEYCDEPLPVNKPRGQPRQEALYQALGTLEVGGKAIEVNRNVGAAQHYAYRFRVERGREMRFVVRKSRPGWCRIWRVK